MDPIRPAAVPCAVDLLTPDPGAARTFYTGLFGWTYDGATALAGGATAATLVPGPAPARWSATFAVPDPEAVAAAATAAGARPDGPELADPLGGRLRLVRDGAPAGPGPGRPCWYEYMTTDPQAADAFLADVLGLPATVPPGAPDASYALLTAAGRPVAGRLALPEPLAGVLPTGWMVYFAVPDPDAAADTAVALGGRLLVPPRDVATGRVAALADPAGAVFTVLAAAPPPA